MLMNTSLNSNMVQALADEVNDILGSLAVLQAWDGTVPASIGAADAGSMLAEIGLSTPVFAAISAGVMSLNATTDDTNTGAGTPTYWRMKQTGGTTIFQWTEGDDFTTTGTPFGSGDTCHVDDIAMSITVVPDDS